MAEETVVATSEAAPAPQPGATPAVATPQGEGQQPGSAPATPAEGEKTPNTAEPPEKQGIRRFERRLDKAVRRAAEAQARADFLEKQLNETRQAQQASQQPSDAPLRLEDYNYDNEAFAKAVAAREREKLSREYTHAQQRAREQEFTQRLSRSWVEATAKGNEAYEDFDEIVGNLQPTTPLAIAVMQAENAHEVAYFLGTHPKEAQRIYALDPGSQFREIGKLEAKLAFEAKGRPAQSKAPAPIVPLTPAGVDTDPNPKAGDSIEDWIKKRQKQVHGR